MHRALDDEFDTLLGKCRNFVAFMDGKMSCIQKSMQEATEAIGRRGNGWESVNIFSPPITCEILRGLQEQSTPRELSYANYIRKHMYKIEEISKHEGFDPDWFMKLLEEEITRVYVMPNGGIQAALELYLDVKIDILQSPGETISCMTQYHEQITQKICDILQILIYQGRPFLNLARTCRRLRKRMDRNECGGDGSDKCVYNLLLPTLDMLQRYSYTEIQENVHNAIGHRLPAELTHLVFEYTMASEEVPLDPRIFVAAKHKDITIRSRKARQACRHYRPACRDYMLLSEDRYYTYGPNWIETIPEFPHHDPSKREEELDSLKHNAYLIW
ncbi:hypothetical protein BU26DRAFT_599650 [Trematosphaeria pertusa]|uniref:Uncharacterized protein n=1 Tax=Trematosphaeria pertusa TaxID=390896 RepID=A0A6A6J2Y7_9PLEO|nr:uncharacterized protein BU26DRAFT_599650 [Trematosphaeria pertusa]KAF2257079.1 hypothetical protein BU26DRAFT_599650 [Trematosphaeria pertusa]